MFFIQSRGGLKWLEAANLRHFSWLIQAFGTRWGAASAASTPGWDRGPVEPCGDPSEKENHNKFLKALGAANFALASVHQIHSAEIFVVQNAGGHLNYLPSGYPLSFQMDERPFSGDALLTASPGILLAIRTADCIPILLVDPRLRIVGAIHAGWRGALKRIVEKTVGEMRRIFGSRPQDLFAALGPSIRACCYEVGDEVVDAFGGAFVEGESFFRKTSGSGEGHAMVSGMSFLSMAPPGHTPLQGSHSSLDLVAAVKNQLKSARVPRTHIQTADFCTSCRTDLFFSYRKEGRRTGRMMAVIGIKG
jgi:YfiH family protein